MLLMGKHHVIHRGPTNGDAFLEGVGARVRLSQEEDHRIVGGGELLRGMRPVTVLEEARLPDEHRGGDRLGERLFGVDEATDVLSEMGDGGKLHGAGKHRPALKRLQVPALAT